MKIKEFAIGFVIFMMIYVPVSTLIEVHKIIESGSIWTVYGSFMTLLCFYIFEGVEATSTKIKNRVASTQYKRH